MIPHMNTKNTASKLSVLEVIVVRIFPHSDRIRRDTSISPYLIRMWEKTDQNNSIYGHFLRSKNHQNLNLIFRERKKIWKVFSGLASKINLTHLLLKPKLPKCTFHLKSYFIKLPADDKN